MKTAQWGRPPLNRIRPTGPAIVLAVLVAFVLVACGGATTGGPAASLGPPDKVTILTDFLLYGWHSPLFAGKAEGFYKEKNIDLTIVAGQGSADGAVKVGSGAAQFGQIDVVSALVAISKGANLKLIGVYFKGHPGGLCYVKGRTNIQTYKDIEGIKIGAAAGDAYMVALPGLMRQAGADPNKYKLVTMTAAATTAEMLAGHVDATPCGLPTFSSRESGAAKQGQHLAFFSFGDNGFSALGFGLVVNGDVYKNQSDLVQRFVDAWAKSAIWSLRNSDKAVADFVAANPEQDAAVAKQSFSDVIPLIKGAGGDYFVFDSGQQQKTVDFVNEAYSARLNAADAFTNQFVNKLPSALRKGNLP